MKGWNSKWKFKNRKLIHFGVDYFKSYIEFKYTPKIFKLWLSQNSNIFFYDDETYIELQSPDLYKQFEKYFIIKDRKTNINLWFVIIPKVWKVWAITYNNIFEVSGQGLILRKLKFYFDFIKWAWFKIEKFKRVDICFDLEENINYINDRVINKYIKWKTIEPIIKKWVLETLYIWERNTKKNTYQVIRIYNKIIDTKAKNKEFLYDLDNIKDLTRFEVELRRDKAKFFTPEKLLNDDYLFSVIVKTFYKMNYQYFKFLHLEDFKKIRNLNDSLYESRKIAIEKRQKNFILYWKDFKNDSDEQRTLKIFINSAKRLYKNWKNRKYLLKILKNHGII